MKDLNAIGLSVAALASIVLTGCATASPAPVNGVFFSDVKGPGMATNAFGASAHGEACATSILGVYASGDASIEAAKKAAGIMQVVTVDYSAYSLLGLYAQSCTHVYGKKGGKAAAAPAAPAAPAGDM